MAARSSSPTHAFDPTPALEHNANNYSPVESAQERDSPTDLKGVRFSDHSFMPTQGRHSIATTNVPLLPAVSSASQMPKHAFQIVRPPPGVDVDAYFEHCRRLNTQLRESHNSERKTWDIERSALTARIAQLEQKLRRNKDPKRRSSNDSSSANLHSFRSQVLPSASNGRTRQRFASEPTISEKPVWIGPGVTLPVTRVFNHDDEANHMPSISEFEAMPVLSQEISPTSCGAENVPIPIEQVDNTLDGITLRSAALTSSFDNAITSPARSPSPRPRQDEPLKVDFPSLLSPMDEKLKRHAGHTPMVLGGTLSSDATSTVLTPRQEKPVEPAPTRGPPLRPSENSNSYFSSNSLGDGDRKENYEEAQPLREPEDDPALKGPLMLGSNAKAPESATFLNALNAKLVEEQANQQRDAARLSGDNEEHNGNGSKTASSGAEDDMPKLRMKNSRNFGSAWGQA